MDLPELLDHLHANGATLDLPTPDTLRLVGPARVRTDADVIDAITANKALLLAHVHGARTGHALGFCTECGAASLTHYKPASKYPTCRMTPGCPGRHDLRPADVARLTESQAPDRSKQTKPPKRPPKRHLLGPWPTNPWPVPDGAS